MKSLRRSPWARALYAVGFVGLAALLFEGDRFLTAGVLTLCTFGDVRVGGPA